MGKMHVTVLGLASPSEAPVLFWLLSLMHIALQFRSCPFSWGGGSRDQALKHALDSVLQFISWSRVSLGDRLEPLASLLLNIVPSINETWVDGYTRYVAWEPNYVVLRDCCGLVVD
jgi:hypothetical protein